MKRLISFIIIVFSLLSCEKSIKEKIPEEMYIYDLFPLSVGNEYYYSYSYYNRTVGENPDVKLGNIQITITSESDSNRTRIYKFEKVFYNGVYYGAWGISDRIDTMILEEAVSFFKVLESRSGELTFEDFIIPSEYDFQRYLTISDTIIKVGGGIDQWNTTLYFVADTGLTRISHGRSTAMHSWTYTYSLDSSNITK